MRAEGPDFSFGGDIVDWPDADVRQLRTLFESYMQVFNQFERLPLPVIAAVQGLCFGGGLELALRADVVFAAESARFGHPEQTLGIVTLLGGIYRVAERAGRARASEWALTSEQVPATVMADAGVINRVVADDVLLPEATAFVRKVAKAPPAPTPPTRPCCAPGPSAGSRRRTRRCSTSPCRSSKPTT
ncbi:enoyl-CoA hydratase/isomerase family protein [Streptomyces sp. NPDC001307]|uniref:enoyl-CoA hydratase/isomerase family protein n=1 Tax=Streptomyces sp. NPDC001307 TaxID=3364560 RepID=UPI00367B34ED